MRLIDRQATMSERYVAFHRAEAGSPDCYNDPAGDYYFAPADYEGGVFSEGYPTLAAALVAAEAWEALEAIEDGDFTEAHLRAAEAAGHIRNVRLVDIEPGPAPAEVRFAWDC